MNIPPISAYVIIVSKLFKIGFISEKTTKNRPFTELRAIII